MITVESSYWFQTNKDRLQYRFQAQKPDEESLKKTTSIRDNRKEHEAEQSSAVDRMIENLQKQKKRLIKQRAKIQAQIRELMAQKEATPTQNTHQTPQKSETIQAKAEEMISLRTQEPSSETMEGEIAILDALAQGDIKERDLAGLIEQPVHISSTMPKHTQVAMLQARLTTLNDSIASIDGKISDLQAQKLKSIDVYA